MLFAISYSRSPDPPELAVCLAVAFVLLLALVWRRVRGTTLAAPAAWAVAAVACIALVEGMVALNLEWQGSLAASIARYAAAAGTCCPVVAVLGSKRPQDRGWQWVVLSLWVVLLVPAGQAWMTHTSSELLLPWPWCGALLVLIALGPLNYLATRWGVASALTAFAQYILLGPYTQLELWTRGDEAQTAATLPALGLALVALAIPALWSLFEPKAAASTPLEILTCRWLAFRNGWGAFWGLRILNRINETAELSAWPVRLHWSGFALVDATANLDLNDGDAAHITQTMDSLLRRFERLEAPSPI